MKKNLLAPLLISIIAIAMATCTQLPLKDKKILIVIAPQNFRDEEFTEPKAAFERLGAKVEVASTQLGTAKGMLGLEAKIDLLIVNANPNDYSAIVIAGGIGSKQYLWSDKNLQELVKQFQYRNKVVAAICLSPAILAKAGLLNGREATAYPDSEAMQILRDNGAIYSDKSVIISDKIVTARDPESAKEFAAAVINLLLAS
jgi:protease I